MGGAREQLATASGIALSGGYIYNSLAGGNLDAVETEAKTLDVCLSHPTPFGQFHYHFWTACSVKGYGFWDNAAAPSLCRGTKDCTTDPGKMSVEQAKSG